MFDPRRSVDCVVFGQRPTAAEVKGVELRVVPPSGASPSACRQR